MNEFLVGDRVRHEHTGETGLVTRVEGTYSPIHQEWAYLVWVDGDDGREWIANGCALVREDA